STAHAPRVLGQGKILPTGPPSTSRDGGRFLTGRGVPNPHASRRRRTLRGRPGAARPIPRHGQVRQRERIVPARRRAELPRTSGGGGHADSERTARLDRPETTVGSHRVVQG